MKKRFLLLVWVLGILIPLFGIKKYHDLNNNEIALKIIAEIKNLAGQSLDLNYFDSEGVTSYDHKEWAQLLTKHSEEGNVEGLELIPINTKKFIFPDSNLKVPNMGWSEIEIKQKHSYLSGFQTTPRFYFVHSYFMDAEQTDYVIAEARYGHQFAAVVANGNVVGMQFHPEKSDKIGLKIISNFINL